MDNKIKIGIATHEGLRERALQIARGKRRRQFDEPKIWFSSLESLDKVLFEAGQEDVMLRIADYPQLKLIAWSRPGAESISEEDAFALYEMNWRFVDRDALTSKEQALIARLTRKYGHGVMNV